jgi:hypothetical protein
MLDVQKQYFNSYIFQNKAGKTYKKPFDKPSICIQYKSVKTIAYTQTKKQNWKLIIRLE